MVPIDANKAGELEKTGEVSLWGLCRGRCFMKWIAQYEFELLAGIRRHLMRSPWTKAL
jgi:hypothetical protein